jgi:hypothetical protein
LRVLVEGGRFIVNSSDKNLTVSFSMRSGEPICDVAMLVLVVGDLKFYAQTLGRDNMSSHWCMWCKEHPNTWDQLNAASSVELWTLEHMVEHRHKIIREKLKDPKEICGIVDFPVWDFIEPLNYIIPQLHIEIGLINYVLENFYDFIEEQVEVAPPKEQMARNSMILNDVAVIKAIERLDKWHVIGNVDLAMQCYSKPELLKALRA